MNLERKTLEVKDVTKSGDVAATVATLKQWDKDNDWTEKGFFGTQPTAILGAHDRTDIMLGKGTITDENSKTAEFEGKFNLEDPDAVRVHSKLRFDNKNPPPQIEWSYSYLFNPGGFAEGERDGKVGRILQRGEDGGPGARIPEVSPVTVGAGEGTRTRAVKDNGSKQKFTEEATAVLTDVGSLIDRAAEVVTYRREQGKPPIGSESKELLDEIVEQLKRLESVLTDPAGEPDPEFNPDAEYAQYQAHLARLSGVGV